MSDSDRDTPGLDAIPVNRPSPKTAALNRADRRSLFALVAIAVLLIGAVGLSLFSHWDTLTENGLALTPLQSAANTDSASEDFTTRVTALEQRLAGLETGTAGAQPGSAPLDDVRSLVATIDTRLTALEAKIAEGPSNDAIAALQGRITSLESETADARLRRAAATLALANLARAADLAVPFKPELDALAAIAPGDPAIVELTPLADSSTPSLRELREAFPGAARAAIEAEREAMAGADVFARMWSGLGRIVSIRRIGDARGTTTEDRLARAGADLDRGELARAVAEATRLAGTAADSMAPWTRSAQARLTLDRAVEGMNARIVQTLIPAPGTAGQ